MNKCSLSLQRTFAHNNMSPRKKRLRKVINPPCIKGLKPFGSSRGEESHGSVSLLIEEYEALRLCDYEMHNHLESSHIMGVSRPTFTRIYASARQKIARALVEGSQINIDGGKIYFDSDWYHCKQCSCYFNNPDKEIKAEACPLCKSTEIRSVGQKEARMRGFAQHRVNICICPSCNFELEHKYGHPCGLQICPKCNIRMTRKRMSGGRKIH